MRPTITLFSLVSLIAVVAAYLAGRNSNQNQNVSVEMQVCLYQVNATLQAIADLEHACEQCASERARCAYSERPPPPSDTEQSKYPDPRNAVPFYRAFSRNFNDHLYTTNNEWVEEHVRDFDHIRQGIAAYIFPTPEINTQPLYQLYKPSWHNHLYTTSLAEREDVLVTWGYQNEGITGYIFLTAASGGKPLYRLWSNGRKDHLYTVSERERSQAMGRGYSCEGIMGYVYPASPH